MDLARPPTQNATIVCVGQGYGFVDVSWFRFRRGNERFLPRKSIVTTMVTPNNITSVLTISDLRNSDRGDYWCRYNNSGGDTNSTRATLTIGGNCLH